MATDIFISYRRHDSSFFAAKLRDRLEQTFPGQVFLDISDIDAGDDFVERLRSAVLSAKAVVAVIGPRWTSNRAGVPVLGESGDLVTEEIGAALEAGIPTVPVLIAGADMPRVEDLPPRLGRLPQRNAVSVSHERFDSDVNLLIAALYKPLGIRPPNRLERMLELVGAEGSQRTRDQYAMFALGASALGLILTILWITVSASDPLEMLTPAAVSAVALVLGILGRNSVRRRRMATASTVVSAATLLGSVALGVWQGASLPIDPWFEAMQVAQAHVNRAEIPAERIVWSNRAPFSVPPPTVACECFTASSLPADPVPYAAGVVMTFTNRCKGPVTFAVSRSRSAMLATAYPWFQASGRDFAVIMLGSAQAVRVPLEGTFGGAAQPWICQKEPPVPIQAR